MGIEDRLFTGHVLIDDGGVPEERLTELTELWEHLIEQVIEDFQDELKENGFHVIVKHYFENGGALLEVSE